MRCQKRARVELVGGDKRNLRNKQKSENSENGGDDPFGQVMYSIYLSNFPYTTKRPNNQNRNYTNTTTKYCFIASSIERVEVVRIR